MLSDLLHGEDAERVDGSDHARQPLLAASSARFTTSPQVAAGEVRLEVDRSVGVEIEHQDGDQHSTEPASVYRKT
jgi:hypothetical protein